jgi:hypothetical protein
MTVDALAVLDQYPTASSKSGGGPVTPIRSLTVGGDWSLNDTARVSS